MTPNQSRVARALLRWSTETLKGKSGVSVRSIKGFEAAARSGEVQQRPETLKAIERVYKTAGITFDADGVNVRLAVKIRNSRRGGG